MEESQSSPATPPPPPPPPPVQYWCYHCDKRVSVETLAGQPDVVCNECKFGFVESISVSPPAYPLSRSSDNGVNADDATLGNQFLQVLRLLAQVAREDDVPPPPPPPNPVPSDANDFLRIEIDAWHNHGDDDDEEEEDEEQREGEEEDVRSVEIEAHSDNDDDEDDEDDDEEVREEEDARRRRRDMLRLRLRDFATRARSDGRNRILDWAEILMGFDDNSIEFRFEMPETDRYIGNPGDYVDAAEYEVLLQNLAEAEGRRGPPPAAKSAVENLLTVQVKCEEESYACAICKDAVNVGEFAKQMPCGHGYHGDCIVPWLNARNSCPICRFELQTDDPDYEEERKKKAGHVGASSGSSGGDTSANL